MALISRISSRFEMKYGWTLVLPVSCTGLGLTTVILVHASRIGRMITCLVLLLLGTMMD